MPRLPRLTSKQIIPLLKKSGFELDHITGSHYIFRSNDKRRVTVPYHNKVLALGTLLTILKQAGIDRKDIPN